MIFVIFVAFVVHVFVSFTQELDGLPSTLVLLGTGLAGLDYLARRGKKT